MTLLFLVTFTTIFIQILSEAACKDLKKKLVILLVKMNIEDIITEKILKVYFKE